MRLLLDTHILLWWLAGDASLPRPAKNAIRDPSNVVAVSAATVWEIAIKKAAGRLDAPDDLIETLLENDFDALPIAAEHAVAAGNLPPHHHDPFDRMLIAQSRLEQLTVVTVDSRFAQYAADLLPLT